MVKDTAPARATFSAAGIAAVVLMVSWCAPALGSSGIEIPSDAAEHSLGDSAATTTSALSAHAETALAKILEDNAVRLPALAETVTERSVDPVEESASAEDDTVPASETSATITRLPGVSDTMLPSFRRQMYRTDI